jgi:hypothetical protein
VLLLLAMACSTEGALRTAPAGSDTDTDAFEEADDTDYTPTNRPEAQIHAAMHRADGRAYFFFGDEYLRFSPGAVEADFEPRVTAEWWDLTPPIDAVTNLDDTTAWFYANDQRHTYELATDTTLASEPAEAPQGVATIEGITEEQTYVDAAYYDGEYLHQFLGAEFISIDVADDVIVDYGYSAFRWPGLWDPHEGTGAYEDRLPTHVADLLVVEPDGAELAARKDRVRASIDGTDYVVVDVPVYTASVEDYLQVWGCLILYDTGRDVHRFRCGTDSTGPQSLDVDEFTVPYVDWRVASYHVTQTHQGDFSADVHTPLSIFASDDGQFYIEEVTTSTYSGLFVRVSFLLDGETHTVGFSHLNTLVPDYVLDAEASGGPLPVGTVFGFVGYTGNLWIAKPPSVDAAYSGAGGLPVSHSHISFGTSLDSHMVLSRKARRAIDYSGRYVFGGG